MEINIGPGAVRLGDYIAGDFTLLALENPVTSDCTITTVRIGIRYAPMINVVIGTYYQTGERNYTCRDAVAVPNFTGPHDTIWEIPGLSLMAKAGDVIGVHFQNGGLYIDRNISTDYILALYEGLAVTPATDYVFNRLRHRISIEATGETAELPPPEMPVSQFEVAVDGLTVTFTNLSVGAVSYLWDFGDGITSAEISPVHTYPGDGTYTIKLYATNAAGTAESLLDITVAAPVTPPPPPPPPEEPGSKKWLYALGGLLVFGIVLSKLRRKK